MFWFGQFLATLAMGCFATGQRKHARVLYSRTAKPLTRRFLSACGSLLLLVCCAVAIAVYGLGTGLVTFFAWACLGAWIVALAITAKRQGN